MAQMLADGGDNLSSASSSQSDLSTVDPLDSSSSHSNSLAGINHCKCRNQSNQKLVSSDNQSDHASQTDQSDSVTQSHVTACYGKNRSDCCKMDHLNGSIDGSISGISNINLGAKKLDPALLDFWICIRVLFLGNFILWALCTNKKWKLSIWVVLVIIYAGDPLKVLLKVLWHNHKL